MYWAANKSAPDDDLNCPNLTPSIGAGGWGVDSFEDPMRRFHRRSAESGATPPFPSPSAFSEPHEEVGMGLSLDNPFRSGEPHGREGMGCSHIRTEAAC